MRLAIKPDSLLEAIALAANHAPEPIVETQIAIVSARAIMAATELGVFSCLVEKSRSASEIAGACALDPRATEALLGALVSTRYLRYTANRYHLTAKSKKWLAPKDGWSLFHYMPHVRDVCRFTDELEGFLRTGKALDIHEAGLTSAEWGRYQCAMRSLSAAAAREVSERIKLKPEPKRMLDIGGSHGFYSVALCRKHQGLCATILDLPAAIEHAAPILAMEGMGDRVRYQAGNALTDELGEALYDLVFISNVVHHFTEEQSRDLTVRAARALRPGGVLAIQELIRPKSPKTGDQIGHVLNLFFALTSTSGTWSIAEMESWLRHAKLDVRRPVFLRSIPGTAQICGVKRRT
ncbi:MAG: methyltransferase domain-containing protein [Bryobacterales bacterium]|nr:methyltransferase domain-containing protein [Bryobacterales bacterium]MBV9399141.1 methyltransferase domain-containing protein [Bryobacterales bacterium]